LVVLLGHSAWASIAQTNYCKDRILVSARLAFQELTRGLAQQLGS
jgi:hypothetical protein